MSCSGTWEMSRRSCRRGRLCCRTRGDFISILAVQTNSSNVSARILNNARHALISTPKPNTRKYLMLTKKRILLYTLLKFTVTCFFSVTCQWIWMQGAKSGRVCAGCHRYVSSSLAPLLVTTTTKPQTQAMLVLERRSFSLTRLIQYPRSIPRLYTRQAGGIISSWWLDGKLQGPLVLSVGCWVCHSGHSFLSAVSASLQ